MKVTTPPGIAALRAYGFEKRYYRCPGQGCCARFPYWTDFKRRITVVYLQGLWWFVMHAYENWEEEVDLITGKDRKSKLPWPQTIMLWRLTSMEYFKQSQI